MQLPRSSQSVKFSGPTTIFLKCVVIGYFLIFVYKHAINAPYFDDFRVISIIREFIADPITKFPGLFQNFNGHRFAFPFSLMSLFSVIEGNYNLKTMMFAGTLMYIGFFLLLQRTMRDAGCSNIFMVPVALIMFQPSIHRDIFWPISTLQYMTSMLLTLIMFYSLCKSGKKFLYLAYLTAVLHPCTNGNAIYIITLATVLLIMLKKYQQATVWAVFVSIYAVIFYLGMPTIVGLNGYSNQSHQVWIAPLNVLTCFFSFLGSTFFVFRLKTIDTIMAGVVLAGFIGWAALTLLLKYQKGIPTRSEIEEDTKLSILFTAISIAVTAAGAAFSRGFSNATIIVDRYEIYSVVSLVLIYCLAIILFSQSCKKVLYRLSIPLSLVYCVYMYWYYMPIADQWRDSLETDIYMLQKNKSIQGKLYPFPVNGFDEFEIALESGFYKFPRTVFDAFDSVLSGELQAKTSKKTEFRFEKHKLPSYGGIFYYQIISDSISKPENRSQRKFILLKKLNGQTSYILAPKWNRNLGYLSFLKMKGQYASGCVVDVYQDTVEPGTYRIGILTLGGPQPDITFSPQVFDMPKEGKLTRY